MAAYESSNTVGPGAEYRETVRVSENAFPQGSPIPYAFAVGPLDPHDHYQTAQNPPFSCLYCDKQFHRRNEWTRHGSDVHQPELKLACPHLGCGSQFSRFYRFKRHYDRKHGGSGAIISESQLRDTSVDKVWACGFCVHCSATWTSLTKHIWSHFQAGLIKTDWSSSIYIQSLLHHSSVRFDWLAVLSGHTDVDQIGWSSLHVQELLSELEWIRPGRKTGPALARMAYDRLNPLESYNIAAQAISSFNPNAGTTDTAFVDTPGYPFSSIANMGSTDHPNSMFAPALEMEWPYAPLDDAPFEGFEIGADVWPDHMALANDIEGSTEGVYNTIDG